MARYLQRISLYPFSQGEIWTGWDLEGLSGEIDGLVLAERMTPDELASYGVSEFQTIPRGYIDFSDFRLLDPSRLEPRTQRASR